MEEIKFTNGKKMEIEASIPKKKSKKIPLIIASAVLIAALVLNKDAVISEYNKLMPEKASVENKTVEESKELPKEESNFIQDTYLNKIDKTRDIKRKANLRDIKFGLELYYSENGSYPVSSGGTKLNDANSSVYNNLIKYASPDSLKDPKDPEYFYLYRSNGLSFELSARLENDIDSECEIADNGFCIYRLSGASAR